MNTPYPEGSSGNRHDWNGKPPVPEGQWVKPTRLEKEPPVPEGHCGDSARLEWEAPIFRRGPGALSEKCSCCRPPRGGVLGRGRTRPLPVLRRKGRARGLQKRDRRFPGGRLVLGLIVEESPTRGGASAEAPGRRARAPPWKAPGWRNRLLSFCLES